MPALSTCLASEEAASPEPVRRLRGSLLRPTPHSPAAETGLVDAYPQLARCAKHQLREDKAMYAHLLDRHTAQMTLKPNLMVLTGPTVFRGAVAEHGTLVAMLLLKAG
jgi:hypothetical protein